MVGNTGGANCNTTDYENIAWEELFQTSMNFFVFLYTTEGR